MSFTPVLHFWFYTSPQKMYRIGLEYYLPLFGNCADIHLSLSMGIDSWRSVQNAIAWSYHKNYSKRYSGVLRSGIRLLSSCYGNSSALVSSSRQQNSSRIRLSSIARQAKSMTLYSETPHSQPCTPGDGRSWSREVVRQAWSAATAQALR
jgi:hypothetical protein